MDRIVTVLPDKPALVQRALELVVTRLQAAVEQRGLGTIVLAGGSTPKPLYEAIAGKDLAWDKIHIFWGDERYVPSDHPDSNQGMARKAWLDRVAIPPENIHPMPTNAGDPAIDAAQHEQELQTFFKIEPGTFPPFDIILLGMGDDGHTASLFPSTQALQVCDRLITVGNKGKDPRITFTIPLINQANTVIFLVAGAGKQTALAQVFADEADPTLYPSRFIRPQGELCWLLDQAAGANLETI
ncbi:MAG: 6-phosphogluconolactonase [Cyanothece sp. SIO1E1]|nr:6-phosphogluconolactonase [Cyanothece sp. SIO1E1]